MFSGTVGIPKIFQILSIKLLSFIRRLLQNNIVNLIILRNYREKMSVTSFIVHNSVTLAH